MNEPPFASFFCCGMDDPITSAFVSKAGMEFDFPKASATVFPSLSDALPTNRVYGGVGCYAPIMAAPGYHQKHASTSQLPTEDVPVPIHGARKCRVCGFNIDDPFMLQVGGDFWHERCLRCACCDCALADGGDGAPPTCYVRNERFYCRQDHRRLFADKCSKCDQPLKPDDLVHRAGTRRFHTSCFQCAHCAQLLKPGDQYVCLDGRVICHRDYSLLFLCAALPVGTSTTPIISTNDIVLATGNEQMTVQLHELERLRNQSLYHGHHSSGGSKRIPKRPRTILNAHQRKAFKCAFEHGSKPSRKLREQLAKETGLSVRVVQVWFQNQRAKIKKELRKKDTDKPSSGASQTMSTDSDGKSCVEDEMKSPLGSGTESDIGDLDMDEEVLSGRSSVSQTQFGTDTREYENDKSMKTQSSDAIDKLYRMHHTYFAFA